MFFNCNELADINLLKDLNVSNSIIFEGIFINCNNLKDISILKIGKFQIQLDLILYFPIVIK